MKVLIKEVVLFGLVGTAGFLVDSLVLYALLASLGPFYARIVSFLAAVLATWLLNRRVTFNAQKSNLPAFSELVTYLGLMLIGGTVNYGAYAMLLVRYSFVLDNPIIGVAAGSLAGMCVNFLTSRFLLFRKQHEPCASDSS